MERYKKIDLDLLLNPLFHGPHEELKGMQWNTPQYFDILREAAFSHTCPECDSEHEDEAHVVITEVESSSNTTLRMLSKTGDTSKKKKHKSDKKTKMSSSPRIVPEIIYYKEDEEADDVRGSFEAYEPVFVVNQLPKVSYTEGNERE